MSNIVFNKKNIVNTKNNSELIYKLPNTVTFSEDDEIGLSQLNIYYSWFNISVANQNNFYQYLWFDMAGNLTQLHDILMPDGLYSIQDINEFLISRLVSNGHYLALKSDPSSYVHFIEFLTNPTYYAIEIRLSSMSNGMMTIGNMIPTLAADLFIDPIGWILPTTYQTPQLLIPANNKFGELIGFNSGYIVPSNVSNVVNRQYLLLNDFTANMQPQNSFIITCNLVKNKLATPNNVLSSFSGGDVDFGELITHSSDGNMMSSISPGSYTEITLNILDQDYKPLNILDGNMLIVLSIKNNKKN